MIRRIRFGEPTTSPGLVTNNDGMAPSQSLPEIQSTPGLIMEKQTPTFYPCYRAGNLRLREGDKTQNQKGFDSATIQTAPVTRKLRAHSDQAK